MWTEDFQFPAVFPVINANTKHSVMLFTIILTSFKFFEESWLHCGSDLCFSHSEDTLALTGSFILTHSYGKPVSSKMLIVWGIAFLLHESSLVRFYSTVFVLPVIKAEHYCCYYFSFSDFPALLKF